MVKNVCVAYHLTRHALMNTGNDDMSIQNELGLGRDKSVATKQKQVEHTLKTWRSLFRSDFHPAIMSLSSLERRNREILPRSLRFDTSP